MLNSIWKRWPAMEAVSAYFFTTLLRNVRISTEKTGLRGFNCHSCWTRFTRRAFQLDIPETNWRGSLKRIVLFVAWEFSFVAGDNVFCKFRDFVSFYAQHAHACVSYSSQHVLLGHSLDQSRDPKLKFSKFRERFLRWLVNKTRIAMSVGEAIELVKRVLFFWVIIMEKFLQGSSLRS